jgi:hypothetical protein
VAVARTTIEAVRVTNADGTSFVHPWNPDLWYQIRDDHPHLDILTRGFPAQFIDDDATMITLAEPCAEGSQWQRWDMSEVLSRHRRVGEMTAALKVPKSAILRCYVIPAALLSYGDVIAMAEDVEAELDPAGTWDVLAKLPDRTWSNPRDALRSGMPTELIRLVEEEMRAAASIRRDPFTELAPRSRLGVPLAENAIVSQWAARRTTQLSDQLKSIEPNLVSATARADRVNPLERQKNLDKEATRLRSITLRIGELKASLSGMIRAEELGAQVHPGPLLQRDHRLRLLLRAFVAPPLDAMTDTESARSHYPPTFLNNLWELWGVVWIVKELRRLGFSGCCSHEGVEAIERCQWHLTRGSFIVEVDFEAEPALVDYNRLPPVQDRIIPVLEWAAGNQDLDVERPFIGMEEKCSPDYLIRITSPDGRALLVGDACLASPEHHGKRSKSDSKPYTVEQYRRTIGWAIGDQVTRCHPMGGFVIFPPPTDRWSELETLPGASDCMLLCPSPQGSVEASRRFELLLRSATVGFDLSVEQVVND